MKFIFKAFYEIFIFNLGLVWFDLVVYYAWNWSKSFAQPLTEIDVLINKKNIERFSLRDFVEIFILNLGLVWFDLVVYQISTFYYVWNWSKSLVWWWWWWWC